MKLIKRTKYLDLLNNVKNTPDIKVITGVRRCGKSKLLELFAKQLETKKKNNCIFIDLRLKKFIDLHDPNNLYEYIKSKYYKSKRNYLFIDEVQLCKGFETIINSLHAEELFDIYLTGSNAFLLSSDLATLFTGRTFAIDVLPFSFKEYIDYYKFKDIDKAFDKYVLEGGFAGSYVYSSLSNKYKYIREDIYQTIVQHDLIQKYNIRQKQILYSLTNFLANNIGNLTNPLKLTNYLISSKQNISNKTINNFINYLCNTFVFYKVSRYDLKGKMYLATQNKYYLVDPSVKYATLGTKNLDTGRVYENLVYLELKRRGYDVYIGKLYKNEIDFVATKQSEQLYIQVAAHLNDEKTIKREIEPLLKIKDAYPKIIITKLNSIDYQIEGVKVLDIAR